jgi:beta-glucosidase
MVDRTLVFPPDFVWGSATAAHQVEGNNRHNDWWAHELAADTNALEPSGIACDHYRRYADDFRLLKELGHAAHRLSIEWSRIEPDEGTIDRGEVDHYRGVLSCLRGLGIEPWVTLHHFTSPLWFARRGGFAKSENVSRFRRFVELMAREYGDMVSHWCTINEPNVVAEMGYRLGYFPPRIQDPALCAVVLENFFRAHTAACEALGTHAKATPQAGITLAVMAHEPYRSDSDADRALAARRDAEWNGVCFDALRTGVFAYPDRAPEAIAGLAGSSNFIGVQYYSRMRYDAESGGPAPADPRRTLSQMGWEVYPEGLAPLLRRAAATGLPVYVTENGICCDDDRVRVEYIADHLAVVDDVRREGAAARGYFYWSAMDNFEWNFGYGPKFGLIEVDRSTLQRRPRPSARFFAEAAGTRTVTPEMVRRYQEAGAPGN